MLKSLKLLYPDKYSMLPANSFNQKLIRMIEKSQENSNNEAD